MKTLALIVTVLVLAGALGSFITRDRSPARIAQAAPELATSQGEGTDAPPVRAATVESEAAAEPREPASAATSPAQSTPTQTAAPKPVSALIFNQAVETLLSGQAPFAQKQAAWGQLRDAGKLDQLIAELEQRAPAQPNSPEIPATLGQAYLHKAGTITDLREQGILGMKADQSFEAALNVDGSNWEARFWKAAAMSYWPPQLGKGKEVIENFLELLKQQEVVPPQPQFAQTYLLLGDQYQKQGQPEYASQIWKRGLGLFPDNTNLQQKLSETQQ